MKKITYLLLTLLFVGVNGCREEDFSAREHYKYLVYMLSENNYNVFSAEYDLNKMDPDGYITSHLTIGCGGSLSNPEEFVIELEPDDVLFDAFNRSNYDIDAAKYAQLLPKEKYEIGSYRIVFPAKNADQYVKVPVKVKVEGLSPDSIYFIPVSIKSTSKYEVNKEKSGVLFRVTLKNEYAEQLSNTYYQLRGSMIEAGGNINVSTSKLARPLTKNSIRLYAGANMQDINNATVEQIEKYSIVLSVDENRRVQITPYGSIEIEQINDDPEWNKYEEGKTYADNKIVKRFYLYYRYRTLRSPASKNRPAVWDNWITIKETLKRIE